MGSFPIEGVDAPPFLSDLIFGKALTPLAYRYGVRVQREGNENIQVHRCGGNGEAGFEFGRISLLREIKVQDYIIPASGKPFSGYVGKCLLLRYK
tara:strand:+ start:322 stop:606 length:285 start_codon:yes stop_codon:yes gene_type:complete